MSKKMYSQWKGMKDEEGKETKIRKKPKQQVTTTVKRKKTKQKNPLRKSENVSLYRVDDKEMLPCHLGSAPFQWAHWHLQNSFNGGQCRLAVTVSRICSVTV